MLSWLFGTGQTICVLFHGEDHLSRSQLCSDASSSLCKTEALWVFPYHLHGGRPCLAHVGETLW